MWGIFSKSRQFMAIGVALLLFTGCSGSGGGSDGKNLFEEAQSSICRFGKSDAFLRQRPTSFFLNQYYPSQTEDDIVDAQPFFSPGSVPTTGLGLFAASHSRFYRQFVRQLAAVDGSDLSAHGNLEHHQVLLHGPLPAADKGDVLQVLFEELDQSAVPIEWPDSSPNDLSPLQQQPYLSFIMNYNAPSSAGERDLTSEFARACKQVVAEETELLFQENSSTSLQDIRTSLEVIEVGNSRDLMDLRVAVLD